MKVEIDPAKGIATIRPTGPLSVQDFEQASKVVDPYIKEHGNINGVIIHTRSFPGWESFGSLVSHIKFVKEHHKLVKKVAVVTDATLGEFAEKVASHFVAAVIKDFDFDELDEAVAWISEGL